MSDADDRLASRYRSLAREEPPPALDAAILAASREAPRLDAASDAHAPHRRPFTRWMGPVSIAAVLVLGIGVSLHMQLEQPGIETSMPPPEAASAKSPAAAAAPEAQPQSQAEPTAPGTAPPSIAPPLPLATKPAARGAEERLSPRAQRADVPAEAERRQDAASDLARGRFAPEPKAIAQAPAAAEQAPVVAAARAPASETTKSPAPAAAPPSPPATSAFSRAPMRAPEAPPPAAMPAPAAPPSSSALGNLAARPAPPQALADAAAPRARREMAASGAAPSRELKKQAGAIPDPDPQRELERIARLREAGLHEEADRALEAFRRTHPNHRIPDAMWEKVRPR